MRVEASARYHCSHCRFKSWYRKAIIIHERYCRQRPDRATRQVRAERVVLIQERLELE